uniref:Sxd1 n=1 Tax=Arundo donax TaxID=35708 RepID=A0A0A9HZH9_ARUDO
MIPITCVITSMEIGRRERKTDADFFAIIYVR